MGCRLAQLHLAARQVARLADAADGRLAAAVGGKLAAWGLPWPGTILVVRDERPVSFTAGIWTPRLVISTGALANLADADLQAVVAHELAHVARNEAAWRIVGTLATLAHAPILGRRSLRAWLAASEAICDEAAAVRLGSRLAVAHTIVRFQRLLNAHLGVAPVVAPAFTGVGALEARVRRLLGPGSTNSDVLARHWPWLAALVALWQIDTIHVALEWLLRLIHA
jgi:Zn-dependent protease with chaperone function